MPASSCDLLPENYTPAAGNVKSAADRKTAPLKKTQKSCIIVKTMQKQYIGLDDLV